jgi:methylmalonyl-CoA mutase cobalamin-binding subunit
MSGEDWCKLPDFLEAPVNKVVVSVADDNMDDMPAVVAALREAGLVVDDVMETLGMVTGSVASEQIWSLRAVPGVAGVERQRAVGLLPPDSPGV